MTTICAVRNGQQVAIAGDGQVTAGEKYIMKGNAQKIHRIFDNRVLSGFAGGVADAVTLQDRFESKLKKYNGDLRRSAVELAQDWRKDQMLQKLEAMLIVADKKDLLLVQETVKLSSQNLMFLPLDLVAILLKQQRWDYLKILI